MEAMARKECSILGLEFFGILTVELSGDHRNLDVFTDTIDIDASRFVVGHSVWGKK